ncbi:hypothetical protein [Paractinoplanes rishiriensis]|uniref:Uncharacterized protein n=1 Tax=Paractinoplanes rishiriensis TaxID=1050105 RepID=A0A919K950_9ACTN|nr:hypothetical protein [Actinoplanes rishiriensis]GIF00940.1 hypothetical protein Ari01nite_84040 [Actinoplanes rishiriensis]
MSNAVSRVSTGSTYASMAEMRAHHAQLVSDIRAGADPLVIAADKAKVAAATHQLTIVAGRLDVYA